jgi:tetratricopeptide (TPR) repeat protein
MHFFRRKTFPFSIVVILILLSLFSTTLDAQSERRRYVQQRKIAIQLFLEGRFVEAEKLFLDSFHQAELQRDDYSVALSLSGLGDVWYCEERFAEAEDAYKRSLSILRRTPDGELLVAIVLRNLGAAYITNARFRDAAMALNEASQIAKKLHDVPAELSGQILNSFGMNYYYQGKMSKSQPLFEAARQIYSADPTLQIDLAQTLNNLAQVHRYRHRSDKAEELYREALAVAETAVGSEHPDLIVLLDNFGSFLVDQKRYGEAEDQLRRSLGIQEQVRPVIAGRMIHTLHELGRIYLSIGDRQKAEAPLARAVDVAMSNHVSTREAVDILEAYALLLDGAGKRQQAEEIHSKAIRTRAALSFTVRVHDLN